MPGDGARTRAVSVPLRLEAPAKINLSLRVVGRRADGFHELESLVVLLELADALLLLPGCSGLRVDGAEGGSVPPSSDNLAWRGLVAGLGGEPDLACLALEKRIPAAAGRGGGSSDAAAAWRLGRAWQDRPDPVTGEELVVLSAIGADVPFFAAGVAAARVGGIGERVAPVPAAQRDVVLVHPPFGLSTAEVFAALDAGDWGRLENDLLAPARRLRPELDGLFEVVRSEGGEPRLTGSGPTIFSLEDEPERAAALAERLRTRGLRTTHTRTPTTAASIERIEEEPSA